MQQTDFEHLETCWFEDWKEDGSDVSIGWYCPRCHAPEGDTGPCAKHFSTDIAAAWEVVETMEVHGWNLMLSKTMDGIWMVWFHRVGYESTEGAGGTVSRGICLAALVAKGVEVPA
jgi:hypothetical protein